jgi:hypothetical protein
VIPLDLIGKGRGRDRTYNLVARLGASSIRGGTRPVSWVVGSIGSRRHIDFPPTHLGIIDRY